MPNQSGHPNSLRQVQDCATAMRRWLAADDNSAALMAHLRAEPGRPGVVEHLPAPAPRTHPVGRHRAPDRCARTRARDTELGTAQAAGIT